MRRPIIALLAMSVVACGTSEESDTPSREAKTAVPNTAKDHEITPADGPIEASEPEMQKTLASYSPNSKTAISCDNNGTSEIYVIDEDRKVVEYYNQKTRTIGPWCSGSCNWSFSENTIKWENPNNGFIIGSTIDRVQGTMISRLALGPPDYITMQCRKVPLPDVAENKF